MVLFEEDKIKRIHHCDCTAGSCDNAPEDPLAAPKRTAPMETWSLCPLGEMRNPLFLATVQISQLADISPLDGWPDAYSAGVVDGVMAFRQMRSEIADRQAKKAQADAERAAATSTTTRGRSR